MQAYIYCADIYCADCGEAIIRERILNGKLPDGTTAEVLFDGNWEVQFDETQFDSDEFPKGPYPEEGGESDCPEHCASGSDCINAIEWSDGSKAGAFLENPLTTDGELGE